MSTEPAAASAMFQLDRATCLTLLTTQHVGRLVLAGDELSIIPLNYVVVDTGIMFRTERAGRTARATGASAMFEADSVDERTRSGWSVVVHGTLTEVPDGTSPPLLDTWAPGDRDRWVLLAIDTVTGRLLRNVAEPSPAAGGYL